MSLGYQKNKTSILIPMRSLNEGKTRLSNLLSPSKREKLIKLLFTQLLKKLKSLKNQFPLIFSDILVITPCEEVEKISKDFHVHVLKEQILNDKNNDIEIIEMAKKVDYSVEERLRALYDLQLIDSRIDKLRSVRGELPLEVEDLEDEVSGLDVRLEKIQAELESYKDPEDEDKRDTIQAQDILMLDRISI